MFFTISIHSLCCKIYESLFIYHVWFSVLVCLYVVPTFNGYLICLTSLFLCVSINLLFLLLFYYYFILFYDMILLFYFYYYFIIIIIIIYYFFINFLQIYHTFIYIHININTCLIFTRDIRQPLSQIRLSLSVSLGAGQIIFLAGIKATEKTVGGSLPYVVFIRRHPP